MKNNVKVELDGIVGNIILREPYPDDKFISSFRLEAYYWWKGDKVTMDTVNFLVRANEVNGVSRDVIESIKKGDEVHICGRLQLVPCKESNGEVKVIYYIIAHEIKKIK